MLAGLVGVGLAMLLGNLAGGIQFLEGPTLAGYDWWSPSRVIDGTANEFRTSASCSPTCTRT